MLEIVDKEKPVGVIVQYGGQTPLKLALDLEANGVPIIGTTRFHRHRRGPRALPEAAARAGPQTAAQPHCAHRRGRARGWRREIGYPLVVRPSYVLGGRAMEIVHGDRTWSAICAKPSGSGKVAGAAGPLPERRWVDVDASPTASRRRDDRRHHGAHRTGRRPLGRLGLFAAAHTLSGRCTVDELRRQTALMAKALKVRPDERAVRYQGSRAA